MPPSRAMIALRLPLALAVTEVTLFWLRRAHPHPLGLTVAEPTMPRTLGSYGVGTGGGSEVCLVYGYPGDSARPLIEVLTRSSDAHRRLLTLKEALTQAEHRDAAWARGDWKDPIDPFGRRGSPLDPPTVPVPASGFAHQDRAVVIDGERRIIPVVSFRHYEALSFNRGTDVVTAVARFGFPDVPSFYTVDDLRPYAAGFRRSMLDKLRRPEA